MKTENLKHKLAIILIILPVCLFSQKSEFDLGFSHDVKLVPLNFEISEEAIAAVYYPKKTVFYGQSGDNNVSQTGQVSSYTIDEKTHDTKVLINKYFSEILIDQGSAKFGSIDFNVVYFEQRKKESPFVVFNFITMGIGSLLGVPSYRKTTKVECSICIYDINENLLCCFSGVGVDKYFCGIYYQKNERKSNRDAVKKALKDIDLQISKEIDTLNTRLIASESASICK